jgi:hypothetical protein
MVGTVGGNPFLVFTTPAAVVTAAAAALVLAVTPAAVEEPPRLAQAQNQVAPLGVRNRRQTPQWTRLAPSST